VPERTAELARLAALGARVAADPSQPILADDRSDLYEHVTSALRRLNRADDAKRLANEWASFLEEQAAAAPTAEARSVFDSQRLLAYVSIGEPQRAVPMLEQSERDFPSDYDPPARLAAAYFEMKRYDDALDALARALPRAYGPRKLRLWSLEADVRLAKGDRGGARRALRSAIEFANAIPLPGSYPALKSALEQRLAQLG
jgi:tetratricopeptide (TPR) repeat protein